MRHLKLNINLEDTKSRIPGLFPCYDYENGTFILHNAKDFENGCYDRIVENIKLPIGINLTDNSETILQEGNTYSYKTLLKYYNMFQNNKNDTFISFFKRGIGLIESDRLKISTFTNVLEEKEKILDETITDLIPEFIYLSQIKTIHNKYIRQQKLCAQDIDCDIYERMGGDCMVRYIEYLIVVAEQDADYMFNYADKVNTSSVQGNLQLFTTIDDIGIYETILDEWQPGVEYHEGNIVTYEYETWICTGTTRGILDEESGFYSFDYENFKRVNEKYDLSDGDTLVAYTDSKLKSLRSYKDYTNEIYEVERPNKNEDWLFYYRIGNVSNLEVTTDELGNIMTLDDNINRVEGNYTTNLMAYGDVIDDISYDSKNYTITIDYTTGAHLKAKLRAIKRNFDNKEIFYYYPFEHDDENNRGIRYIETYPYEKGGEIDEIIKNGDFEEFFKNDRDILIKYKTNNKTEYLVDGINLQKVDFDDLPTKELTKYIFFNNEFYIWNEVSYVKINVVQNSYKYNKFRFKVDKNLKSKDIEINNRVISTDYIESRFETKLDENKDTFFNPITKIDYLVGNTFNPIIEHNVNINRGNAASWERHIKLGEVKTLQDLEQYGNDYFNIQRQ